MSTPRPPTSDQRILASSAVMAAGTVFSRASGFIRASLLVVALGALLRADLFTIANTLPNMVYILLAGGVFNAVLVPQLVRRIKDDPDGGDAYASRVITLSALFLGAVTAVLVVAAPLLLRLYLSDRYLEPDRVAHLESIIDLTRWCLPQVFFYGMYVLVGQVLNARGRFGPMMWAPIANNILSVGMLVAYLVVWGSADDAQQLAALDTGQEVLLGLGSTLGIVAQCLVLVPYLRASGFTYRPRFDFRDPELKKTLSLGIWTVLFVIATQAAYFVVVKLASGGGADGNPGYTVYSNSLLIMMVPHSIITVSLATAILPRLSTYAHEDRLADLGSTVGSTLRTALALVLPFAVLLPILADDVAAAAFSWADRDAGAAFAPTLAVFGPALVFFTIHYFMLRGFYAMEMTKVVFFIQLAVSLDQHRGGHRAGAVAPAGGDGPDARRRLPVVVRRGRRRELRGAAAHRRRAADSAAAQVPRPDGDRAGRRRRDHLARHVVDGRPRRPSGTSGRPAPRRAERPGRRAGAARRGAPAADP